MAQTWTKVKHWFSRRDSDRHFPLPRHTYDDILSRYERGDVFFTKEGIRSAWAQAKATDASTVLGDIGLLEQPGDAATKTDDMQQIQRSRHKSNGQLCGDYIAVQHLLAPKVRGGSRRMSRRLKSRNPYVNIETFHREPRESYTAQDVSKVEALLQKGCERWSKSRRYISLMNILDSTRVPCRVTKIVGFALGTPKERDNVKCKSGSLWQHALLMTLRDEFQKRQADGVQVQIYVQDPAYTAADERALENFDVKVVDDPEGFLLVDDNTIVLAFCPSVCIKQVVLDIAKPAMMIWLGVNVVTWEEAQTSFFYDPDTERTKSQCQQSYEQNELEDDDSPGRGFSVWIRRG